MGTLAPNARSGATGLALSGPEPAPEGGLLMPFDLLRSLRARSLLVNQLPKGPYYGILAEFATPADLYHACERVRDAGFTRWDAHTPFPVHGLEGAMGIRRSLLPWIVLVHGIDRRRARVRPAVVGPRQRLPPRDQRQTVLRLAGLHSDHVRGGSSLRRARRGLRHARL